MKRRRWVSTVGAVLCCALVPGAAHAFTEVYLCISGIEGSETVQHDGCIRIYEYHHLVEGETAGNHEPLVFVKKRHEKSTIGLLHALETNDPHGMTLYFEEQVYENRVFYRLDLDHARVVAIEPWSRDISAGDNELERVRVEYQAIDVTYTHYPASGGPQSETYRLSAGGGAP